MMTGHGFSEYFIHPYMERKTMASKIQAVNLDDATSAFFSRELDVVKAKTVDIRYPALKGLSIVPPSYDTPAGAQTVTYQSYDMVGVAKFISNYADDLPLSDIKGREYTVRVRSIGQAYQYSIDDIQAAQLAGKPLDQKRAAAARKANDVLVNKTIFFGSAEHNMFGLLNHPNVTKAQAAASGTGSARTWASKTPDLILADLNTAYSNARKLVKDTEVLDTLLLPIDGHALISTTARSSTSDTTILEFWLKSHPDVKRVEVLNELTDLAIDPATGGAGPVNAFVIMCSDPDCLQVEIPQVFTQYAPQERNLAFVVPCLSKIAGVNIYKPLTVNIISGI